MKTIVRQDFFRRPSLVRSLRPGEQLVVTDRGQPDFVVMKSRRNASTEELARLAAKLLPGRRRKIKVVEKLRNLRG